MPEVAENLTLSSGNGSSSVSMLEPAYYFDGFITVSRCSLTAIGLVLNFWVGVIIVASRRLHWPRHLAWLSVGFSNVFNLTVQFMEVLASHEHQLSFLNLIVHRIGGLPYVYLFVNSVLSLLERHLCLNHTVWYKRKVTNKGIIGAQIGTFMLLCMAFEGRHLWSSSSSLQIQLTLGDIGVSGSIVLGCFILCVAGQAVVRTTSNQAAPLAVAYHVSSIRSDVDEGIPEVTKTSEDEDKDKIFFFRIREERVSRLDLEAARIRVTSVIVLLILYAPALIIMSFAFHCLSKHSDSGMFEPCIPYGRAYFYCQELLNFHCSIFDPVFFVIRSREMRSAIRRTI